ncbi:MAG: hypothetical protein ACK2U1_06565 [Anaerolineales bacterium]
MTRNEEDVFRLDGSLNLAAAESEAGRREYEIRMIKAGRVRAAGNRESNIEIPMEPLQAALNAGMFNNLAVFVDHSGWFEYPKTQRLAATTFDSWQEEDGIHGKIRLYETPLAEALGDMFDNILADGSDSPDVGFSLVFYPVWAPRDNAVITDDDPMVLKEIKHIESVDFVFEPGADGRLIAQLSAHLVNTETLKKTEKIKKSKLEKKIMADENVVVENETLQADLPPGPLLEGKGSKTTPQVDMWLNAVQRQSSNAILAASGLPSHSQERLRNAHYETPEALQAAIDAEREYIASLQADSVVDLGGAPPRSPRIVVGLSGYDELEQAAIALLNGQNPADGVRPLSGIRELYTLLSGDYEMTGVFQGERVMFANVTSSTMAAICANALNKAVINQMAQLPKWWEKAVTKVNFNTLHDAKWITLGGVGELPTVAEGASYDEMTWDDQVETDAFVKKGGYLGITLEAIDKDDTRKIQAAPAMLARAAWMTLGKSISSIFTSNSAVGKTMSDTGALFNATAVTTAGGHANLLTTALSLTQLKVVKIAMMKQPELNSGERLGALTAPYYLWVPVDLEDLAIEILASNEDFYYALANAPSGKVNVYAEGESRQARLASARERVITVPFWTDTNNWAAQANPLLYPSIGVGYRFGENPEIFSVADPRAGLMFTNDVMPVKVRYFYATGPLDWRGLHKSNVA